jgi:hypothetical protein
MVHLVQKYRAKFPCDHQPSLDPFQPIFPTVHLQPGASPGLLQITTAFMHREPPTINGEYKGYKKKQAMNNIKRFSDHQGKDKLRQNVEAQFWRGLDWTGLDSEFALGVPINVLELTSEGIRHFHRKK